MKNEPDYVARLNSLTAYFRLTVKEIVMRKQVALLQEGKRDAADALNDVKDAIYEAFPSVEAEK